MLEFNSLLIDDETLYVAYSFEDVDINDNVFKNEGRFPISVKEALVMLSLTDESRNNYITLLKIEKYGRSKHITSDEYESKKLKAPYSEQSCYDLGYVNPNLHKRDVEFIDIGCTGAYSAGQADAKKHRPKNTNYNAKDYLTVKRID